MLKISDPQAIFSAIKPLNHCKLRLQKMVILGKWQHFENKRRQIMEQRDILHLETPAGSAAYFAAIFLHHNKRELIVIFSKAPASSISKELTSNEPPTKGLFMKKKEIFGLKFGMYNSSFLCDIPLDMAFNCLGISGCRKWISNAAYPSGIRCMHTRLEREHHVVFWRWVAGCPLFHTGCDEHKRTSMLSCIWTRWSIVVSHTLV